MRSRGQVSCDNRAPRGIKRSTRLLAVALTFIAVTIVMPVGASSSGTEDLGAQPFNTATHVPANGDSFSASISASGRYVVFVSDAINIVTGDTNSVSDIFVTDRETGVTTRVSVNSQGQQANGASLKPSITPDGRYVTFL